MIAAVPIVFCLAAPLGWSGCTERTGEEAQAKAAPAPDAAVLASEDAGSADEGELLHITLLPFYPGQGWSVGTGEFDSRNRYSSAVELGELELPPEKRMELCTGVLISPRLVLTAAICVCSPRQAVRSGGGQGVLDAKACAKTVDVKATLYGPPAHLGRSEERSAVYSGVVRVHPEFKRVDDGRQVIVSNEADLAVIVLDRAANVPPVELAESDVKAGESLVVVGYGYPLPEVDGGLWPAGAPFQRASSDRGAEIRRASCFHPPV